MENDSDALQYLDELLIIISFLQLHIQDTFNR